jgi:hypothetical protein
MDDIRVTDGNFPNAWETGVRIADGSGGDSGYRLVVNVDGGATIEELYEWQTNGPVHYDFCGRKPEGTRDAGAIEWVE